MNQLLFKVNYIKEDHRIRDLLVKFENLQLDYQHSLNTIKKKESKLSRAESESCRFREDVKNFCLFLFFQFLLLN